MMKRFNYIVGTIVLVFAFAKETLAWDENLHLVPDKGKENGDYQLSDFVLVALTVAKMILAVSGAMAVLAFVWGGFMFVFSAGNKERVEKGKTSLIGGVIGLAIVLLAYTAVDFFLKSLGWTDGNEDFGKWNAVD